MSEINPSTKFTNLAPFNPTSDSAIEVALSLLKLQKGDTFIDLGCGDGRVLISAAKHEPLLSRCIGLESDIVVLEKAKQRILEYTSLQSTSTSPTVNIQLFELDATSTEATKLLDDIAHECETLQQNSGTITTTSQTTTRCNNIEKKDKEDIYNKQDYNKLAIFVYLVPNGLKLIQPLLFHLVQKGARVVSNMFRAFGELPPKGIQLTATRAVTTSEIQGKQLTPLNIYLYEKDMEVSHQYEQQKMTLPTPLQQKDSTIKTKAPLSASDPAFNQVTSTLGGIKLGGTKATRLAYQYEGRIIYEWEQTLDEVLIFIKPPIGVKALHMAITIYPKRLCIGLKGAPPFMNEDLGGVCIVSESMWTLEPPKRGMETTESGELIITLTKAHRALTWESAFVGHGAMDTASKEAVQRAMLLERFGAENPGFDFSSAEINGNVPDPRIFMNGPGSSSSSKP
jgi:precorrin-6B methylase 2